MADAPEAQVGWAAIFDALPTPYLVLDTDLRIVAVNRARERVTGTSRADVVGRHLFEAFPDNPDDPSASGTRNLRASLERALATRAGWPPKKDRRQDAIAISAAALLAL